MKRIMKIILSFLLVASTLVAIQAKEKESIYYVAVGDSVVTGYGLESDEYTPGKTNLNYKNDNPECYSHIVANQIQEIEGYKGDVFDYYSNISIVGMRVKDMEGIIEDPDYILEYYQEWMGLDEEQANQYKYHDLYIQELQKADLISVEYGNSDLFVESLELMQDNKTIQNNLILKQIASTIETALFTPNKDMQTILGEVIASLQSGIASGEVTLITLNQAIAFLAGDELSKLAIQAARNIADDLPDSIQALQSVNQDASIIILGLYNGFKNESGQQLEFDSPIMSTIYSLLEKTIGEMVDESVNELNSQFEAYCKKNNMSYVDIKSMPLSTSMNLHPDATGHAYIASQVLDCIVKDISITVNNSTATTYTERKKGILGEDVAITIMPEELTKVGLVTVNNEEVEVKDNRFSFIVGNSNIIMIDMVDTFPFSDVSKTKWYYSYIKDVYQLGLMTGTTSTTFNPNGLITRGQLVTILYRMANSPEVEELDSFVDVAQNKFYTKAIAWAKEQGVVKGYSDGTFKPSSPITRQELAIMLRNYSAYCGKDISVNTSVLDDYPDGNSVSSYAKESMAWAIENGLISGDQGYLNPKKTATRAQCAKMVLATNQLL